MSKIPNIFFPRASPRTGKNVSVVIQRLLARNSPRILPPISWSFDSLVPSTFALRTFYFLSPLLSLSRSGSASRYSRHPRAPTRIPIYTYPRAVYQETYDMYTRSSSRGIFRAVFRQSQAGVLEGAPKSYSMLPYLNAKPLQQIPCQIWTILLYHYYTDIARLILGDTFFNLYIYIYIKRDGARHSVRDCSGDEGKFFQLLCRSF